MPAHRLAELAAHKLRGVCADAVCAGAVRHREKRWLWIIGDLPLRSRTRSGLGGVRNLDHPSRPLSATSALAPTACCPAFAQPLALLTVGPGSPRDPCDTRVATCATDSPQAKCILTVFTPRATTHVRPPSQNGIAHVRDNDPGSSGARIHCRNPAPHRSETRGADRARRPGAAGLERISRPRHRNAQAQPPGNSPRSAPTRVDLQAWSNIRGSQALWVSRE